VTTYKAAGLRRDTSIIRIDHQDVLKELKVQATLAAVKIETCLPRTRHLSEKE